MCVCGVQGGHVSLWDMEGKALLFAFDRVVRTFSFSPCLTACRSRLDQHVGVWMDAGSWCDRLELAALGGGQLCGGQRQEW